MMTKMWQRAGVMYRAKVPPARTRQPPPRPEMEARGKGFAFKAQIRCGNPGVRRAHDAPGEHRVHAGGRRRHRLLGGALPVEAAEGVAQREA